MELREWLIILGLALVSLIVVDGVRRLQRQRRVPRLDQAVKDLPAAKFEEFNDEVKEAEINWELPNGGARVVKPADYSNLGQKPKLERQEHPGPSKVLSDFRRSFSNSASSAKSKANAHFSWSRKNEPRKHAQPSAVGHPTSTSHTPVQSDTASAEHTLGMSAIPEPERREPSIFMADENPSNTVSNKTQHTDATRQTTSSNPASTAEAHRPDSQDSQPVSEPTEHYEPGVSGEKVGEKVDVEKKQPTPQHEEAANLEANSHVETVSAGTDEQVASTVKASIEKASEEPSAVAEPTAEAEPTLRVEPEDAVQHAADTPKRRQLRSDTAGEDRELDDDEVDEYRLVDFEGIGRSFKRRLIERRKEKERKKAEKAKRAEALAKQKAERKALEAERKALEAQQRREAKEAADAEKARIAQEQAEAREAAAMKAAAEREAAQYNEPTISAHDESYHDIDDYDDYVPETGHRDNVVRTHPTLEKALRHDVNSERARDALTDASEMVVISVLSREPEGFDGGKLLELIMACGLRYSREMGVFHRFETESFDSELQFSMVNVLKPGTFPIEEMDEFVTPGITFLMPLPGAEDSSAAFEAMVETAMVVVRHMGGELKDENRSVMTAQTIEFARQRVHDFERRHRLHRQLQAR